MLVVQSLVRDALAVHTSEANASQVSEEHGHQVRTSRLLIEADRHHVHDVEDAKVMREAPAQELGVA